MNDQVVYQIARGNDEAIFFTLREFKNRKYLDLRVFFQPKNEEDMKPTKKGLTVTLELLDEIKKGILACEKEVLSGKMSQK